MAVKAMYIRLCDILFFLVLLINMSNITVKNISNVNENPIKDEDNQRLRDNSMLYSISRAFLEKYPQYYDIMTTYEHSILEMMTIITSESTINKQIRINDDLSCAIRINCENARIYSPDSVEALKYAPRICPSPNTALATKGTYSCVLVADFVVSYMITSNPTKVSSLKELKKISRQFSDQSKMSKIVIHDGYIVLVPIPVGCKYCALQHFDELTLRKTAEEMKEYYGFFIIEGFIRYIIPAYKKPFNKPIITTYGEENQLARSDVIYAKKFDYEDSYYIVPAMVIEKSSAAGRKVVSEHYPDFGCSLQLAHPLMNDNRDANNKRNKKLWNFVPIRYLFYAFGCVNDLQMIKYIHPEMNNMLFMNTIKNACIFGHKHLEALEIANIDRKLEHGQYIRMLEPLDRNLALWIIGNIILKDKTKEEAIQRVSNDQNLYKAQIIEITRQILNERFMPGVGDHSNIDRDAAICIELGNIVRELYLIGYGLKPSQDKCSLTNRRVRSGQQISREFKAFHKKRLNEVYGEIESYILKSNIHVGNIPNLNNTLHTKIEQLAALASSDQTKSLINSFKGIAKENSKLRTDILNPKNIGFTWNKLREIVISQDTSQQGADVSWDHRTVHPSELFFICPTQTPEGGGQAGKYKTPTIYTYVTLSTDPDEVVNVVNKHKEVLAYRPEISDPFQIFTIKLNGSCIGWILQPVDDLYNDLMAARRDGRIPKDTSVILSYTLHEINIWTDIGRLVSPFVVVKNAFDVKITEEKDNLALGSVFSIKPDFKAWLEKLNKDCEYYDEGIAKGYIELLDPDMCITNATIADCMKNFISNPCIYTHIALPGHIHGIIANIPAVGNSVTGVRSSYMTNHVKQAIGPTVRYPQCKYEALNNVLISPEVPLARSCVYDFMHVGEHAIGQNVMVAFMQYKDNQEDAIIINRSSVEQGLLEIDSIQTMEYKIEHSEEKFRIPDGSSNFSGNSKGYDNLDPQTCLPKDVSLTFNQFDPLIAKGTINTMNYTNNDNSKNTFIDSSILNETLDGSYQHTMNPRYLRSVVKNSLLDFDTIYKKATFGRYCVPIAGDKFNSEYAQKGTVGKIINNEDIPYTTNGMRPDIIFNPPTIFKRKTYGQLYYPVVAKIAALMGCQVDLTQYHTARTAEELEQMLREIGLDDGGYETMYNPITGKKYRCRIFFGVHYWERQAHLVEMKINVRNGGPRNPITGQPVKGRKRNGGQSLDHMTFDTQIAAGITNIMQDLHMNQGSNMLIGVCNRCNTLGCYYNKKINAWVCPQCGQHPDIMVKEIPPATNLLMGIFNGLYIGIDYYDTIQNYNQHNMHSSQTEKKDEYEKYCDARLIAYNKYLNTYNFEHKIKHDVVKFGQENEAKDRTEYKPITLDQVMSDYQRCIEHNPSIPAKNDEEVYATIDKEVAARRTKKPLATTSVPNKKVENIEENTENNSEA